MDKLFIYLTNLSSNIAYAIIFGILVACGLGFPLPEDIPLIASGYLIWDGTMEWVPTLIVTLLGVVIGDTILFFIGRKLGVKFLSGEKGRSLFKPKKISRARAYFRKYGDKLVFFARFVAGFRAAVFFLSGAMGMTYRRFLLLDFLAAVLSVPVWIGMGYALGHFFGEEIADHLKSIKHLKNTFTLIVFAIVGVVVLRTYIKYRNAKKNTLSAHPSTKFPSKKEAKNGLQST